MQEVGTLSYRFLQTFIASTIETDGPLVLGRLGVRTGGSVITENSNKFSSYYDHLVELSKDRSLWADEDAAPSSESVATARCVLQQLEEVDMPPSKVVATVDSGVAICFVRDARYADIEATSTGEVLGVLSDSINRPTVWEFKPYQSEIAQTIARIRKFIEPDPSGKDDSGAAGSGRLVSSISSVVQAV